NFCRRRRRSGSGWGRWYAAAKPSSRCLADGCRTTALGYQLSKMLDHHEGRLRFLRRATDRPRRRFRRGVYLLPSLFTLGNMFCGYACVVYAMRGEYETAAPFIGFAIVLDMLDGRIARLTGTASDFGLQFDSLADVVSFGIAPAILSFSWGLQP